MFLRTPSFYNKNTIRYFSNEIIDYDNLDKSWNFPVNEVNGYVSIFSCID